MQEFNVTWFGKQERADGPYWIVNSHGPANVVSVGQGLYGDGEDDGTIFDVEKSVPDIGGGIGVTLVAVKKVSDAPHADPSKWRVMRGGSGAQPVRETVGTVLDKGATQVIDAAGDTLKTAIFIGLAYLILTNMGKR